MVLVTQLTAILHAGFQVTCHSFLNLSLCFSRFSRPSILLHESESVILLVDELYTEAIEVLDPSTCAVTRQRIHSSYPWNQTIANSCNNRRNAIRF
jgi:hypothetical protein